MKVQVSALPLTLLLSLVSAVPAAADQAAAPSTNITATRQNPAGSLGCPPETDENVCATLRHPLPANVLKNGPVLNQGLRPDVLNKGLTDQQSLQGRSLGR